MAAFIDTRLILRKIMEEEAPPAPDAIYASSMQQLGPSSVKPLFLLGPKVAQRTRKNWEALFPMATVRSRVRCWWDVFVLGRKAQRKEANLPQIKDEQVLNFLLSSYEKRNDQTTS